MNLPKYLRIQGRETSLQTKKPTGIFALCWRNVYNNGFSDADKEIFMQVEKWFVENLPYPPFYGENNDDANANTDGAITYFKNNDKTNDMLNRLLPVLALLDKYQIHYDIIYTNYVGAIIYEDDYQVGVIDRE